MTACLREIPYCVPGGAYTMAAAWTLRTDDPSKFDPTLIIETLRVNDDNVCRKNTLGSAGFTAHDWLTGPVSPSAILDILRGELRPPEKARSA
ncbi:hypothetical protein ElyMa_002451100 [Elysia marginata]|uniref:Uncharacterized protein n=1 Tax=Elysia marginata TaxID=1093978 RepID=A0AAV4GLB0_9GAST|nr:hypothetical protein ElyMa_002451100 [Elysia marginata]